jgi:hypothetical protein
VTTQKTFDRRDGAETLFDINFLALCADPDEAWRLAAGERRKLKVGRDQRCYAVNREPIAGALLSQGRPLFEVNR